MKYHIKKLSIFTSDNALWQIIFVIIIIIIRFSNQALFKKEGSFQVTKHQRQHAFCGRLKGPATLYLCCMEGTIEPISTKFEISFQILMDKVSHFLKLMTSKYYTSNKQQKEATLLPEICLRRPLHPSASGPCPQV